MAGEFVVEYLAARFPGFFALLLVAASGAFAWSLTLPANQDIGHVRTFIYILIGIMLCSAVWFGYVSHRRRAEKRAGRDVQPEPTTTA